MQWSHPPGTPSSLNQPWPNCHYSDLLWSHLPFSIYPVSFSVSLPLSSSLSLCLLVLRSLCSPLFVLCDEFPSSPACMQRVCVCMCVRVLLCVCHMCVLVCCIAADQVNRVWWKHGLAWCNCWPVHWVWQRAGMSLVMHDVAELSPAVDVMEEKWCVNEGKCRWSQKAVVL